MPPSPTPTTPPPAPHHSLSPSDRHLLARFIDLGQNLRALTADPNTPAAFRTTSPLDTYFALLAWLDSPHIQHALAAHDRAEARAHRTAAATALSSSLAAAATPTERRRAATPLLRLTTTAARAAAVAPRRQPQPAAPPTAAPTPASTPPTPSHHPSAPSDPSAPSTPPTPSFHFHPDTPASRLITRAGAAPPPAPHSDNTLLCQSPSHPAPPPPIPHPATHPPLRDTA